MTWGLLLLALCIGSLSTGVQSLCSREAFESSWEHGSVNWIKSANGSAPGHLRCDKGYVFSGAYDLVYCDDTESKYVKQSKDSKCLEDAYVRDKNVTFQGQVYKFEKIDVGKKTYQYPVLNPNITYVVTTNYTASNHTPTIRVRVGLVGKVKQPVLVNIQQSTESVGFELPLKVVGKASKELGALHEQTIELCPLELDLDDNGKDIPLEEYVKIVLNGGGATAPGKEPRIDIHASAVEHLDLSPGKSIGPTNVLETETLVFRYKWPTDNSIEEVGILVSHFKGDQNQKEGVGADVCAKLSLRSGKCPMEERGVHELTFTRQAFVSVNRLDKRMERLRDGFLVVISVMPDDYECRSSPEDATSMGRTKSIEISLSERPQQSHVYLAIPIVMCCILVVLTYLFYVLFIKPTKYEELDEEIVDVSNDQNRLIAEIAVDPPFEPKMAEINPKMVDLEECADVDLNGGPSRAAQENSDDSADDMMPDFMHQSFTLSGILKKVKENEMVVNLTQTIGHCSVPLVVFLNCFDSTAVDIQGNLKEMTLEGNLDACYFNSRCAYPIEIAGYIIPDISRVTSNLPYLVSGICCYLLAYQKSKAMLPINARGKGVKHDFALFNAIAFITALIGVTSAIYHVCPNRTTSRIDMYFIEILLGYYSLKLYQSRVPDIREVYYAPVITICVMSAVERLLGGTALAWYIIGGFHIFTTFWVSVQLFFMGKVSMNPLVMFKERQKIMDKIRTSYFTPEFKYQAGFFTLALIATISISITAFVGKWDDQAMYNVTALSVDIVIYIAYYILTKQILRKEQMKTRVVVMVAVSIIIWAVSFIFFFAYRTIDTSASPAESRCLNKACIGGFLDGHDLWHCLSAMAIFLTNNMILMFDDDLIDTKTESTYF